jgi:drug/metabolite transporter (DMT)-like permease
MKHITPYTVMLTVNLEPVYGILLAYMILGESEKMKPLFYAGASVILVTVIANGILKHRGKIKNQLGQQGS